MNIPVLHTERLRLQAPSEAMLPFEKAFWATDRSKFVGGPQPEHRIWRTLAIYLGHWALNGFGGFSVVEKASETPVGFVGLWGPDNWPEPELAYHLYAGHEGKGFAKEAGRAVMDWNFGPLGRDRLVSMIDPANKPSQAVSVSLGGFNTGTKFFPDPEESPVDIWRYAAPEAPA